MVFIYFGKGCSNVLRVSIVRMRLKGVCSIVDEYTRSEDKLCEGDAIDYYPTYKAAKSACSENNECDCIDDQNCDGGKFWLKKGSAMKSSIGSCAWTKECKC